MKFVTNLFRAKPASLEEGSVKFRSTNEYYVLHRDKGRTKCGRLVQIVKVILYIELIILIGCLGCVSFSYISTDQNIDYRVSAVGCKASQVDYDDIDVKNSRGSRSVEDTEDGQQMCQRNADVTRRTLESLAAQFVTGEPSDTTVDPLRRDFIKLTVFESLRALARLSAVGGSVKGSTDDIATTTTSLFGSIPNWQEFMEEMSEKFNSTDSQDRQRLEERVVPTAEMTSQLVAITESFYVDVRYCNRLLLNALVSDRELHRSDEDTPRLKRESEPVNQSKPIPEPITAMCWNEEEEDRVLLEERSARQEIFAARSGLGYEYEQRTQQMFLKGIEKALNATSTSEIQFEKELMEETMVIPSIQYLVTNASLKLQKEGYELARDLFMEMHGLNHRGSEWEGWNQHDIARNLTNAIFFSKLNMTSQSIFDNFVRFGEAFNLHYEKPKNRGSGNAPYGKFINLGHEPEKLGVRHLRHTLDNFVRLYYKIQNPTSPGMCTTTVQTRAKRSIDKRFVTETPIWKSATLNCWSKEQDHVLLEERRARLENYLNKELENNTDARFTQIYMEGLAAALNATRTTDIHFDEMLVESTPILRFMNFLLTNSSLELHKEGYEIIRDMWLEMLELKTHSPEWDGYDEQSINENMTALDIPRNVEMNSESIFHGIVKFGIPFNLRYQELANRDSADEPDKPVFGKLIYVGDEPEKLGVRRLRHLLDGFVKLYFKIQDPSTLMVCNLTVKSSGKGGEGETPTRDQRSVEKRAVTPDSVPESITTKCWSEEEVKVLQEERRERLEDFAERNAKNAMYNRNTKNFLDGIKAALKENSTSKMLFKDDRGGPVYQFIESLAENSSLELFKEGYEISRDLYLELHELKNYNPEWEGDNLDRIIFNLTGSLVLSNNMTGDDISFNDIVTFSKIFNLCYEELGKRESGDEPNKPVYGKFTYIGEKPEKAGIRQIRHIFDAITKLYFKTHEPSSVCNWIEQQPAEVGKVETPTADSLSETTNAKCWKMEQDPALLDERRERLKGYDIWNERNKAQHLYMMNNLDAIEKALDVTNPSEIRFDSRWLRSHSIISFMLYVAMNSSLELCKEGLQLTRDLYLEINKLKDHNSEWNGYSLDRMVNNFSDSNRFRVFKDSAEVMFNDLKIFGRAFNLRYEEDRGRKDEPDKPVFGKFIYLGEEPELVGIRHVRHILNGFVRFFFTAQNPSTWGVCNSTAQIRSKRSVEKRAVTTDPVPESITTKCWSEEEDKILEEERLERLAAFAFRTNKKVLDSSHTKVYLEGIEAALNATSISEIHFEDNYHKSVLLTYIESLCENSSLDIRKEGYEINRDLHLEMNELKNHSPEWDGYDLDRLFENVTASPLYTVNATKEAMFNDLITFGNAFSLRYEELGKRETGDESKKPVFGKFTYRGEEPEKLGIRHLRHILDALTKFYFKTQEPSSVCKGGTPTTDPVPDPTNGKCWDMEQDPALLEERRERLEAYALWNERYEAKMFFSKNYMDTLGEALSASSTSEIHFNETWLKSTPLLAFIQDLAKNSSLDLCKEILEIARDLWLELDALEDHTSEWEGYDLHTIQKNLTDTSKSDGSTPTLEIMFDDLKKVGRPLNLRYEEIQNGDSGDKTDKPVLGKFTYIGEEPEAGGVRHMRHILDGFARFYFKVRHPSIAPQCKSTAQTHPKQSVKKRDVTPDPVPESITIKCWSEEEDKILEEERLERLAAFAFRTNKKVMDHSDAKAYLEAIEAALTATSISEINFDENIRKSPLLTYMESLCENSSLDIRKEGYEINRDLHLELYKLRNHNPEWDGYDMDRIHDNLTGSHIFSINMTKEANFNDIIIFSNAFNLRYEELGSRESGDEPNKPVFGKFTYVGEEPEKAGIRHLRHILDAFAKFYFKTQQPSLVCKGGTPTADSVPEATNGKCWNMEQEPALLEERRERLEAYTAWYNKTEAKMLFTKTYMDTLGEALSASNASEIHFDEPWLKTTPLLAFIQDLAKNSSLELCKEALEIARDLWLEIDALEDHTPAWEGYDLNTIQNNLTDTSDSDSVPTLEIMFDDLKKFGRPLNLRYEEIQKGDSGDKTDKPVLGKFTYIGEEPEKMGVRHMRHILDGFARFYFKVRHPSIAPECKSTAKTHLVEKRDVTPDPVPESITTKCWSEEQDKVLEEERLERLAAFAFRTSRKMMDASYSKAFLEGIEGALNATSISEIHFDDNLPKSPLLTYMESLCENSSLEIRKEGYEINRDLHLEVYELKNHSPEWDGYDLKRIHDNLTASDLFSDNATKEGIFNDIVTFSNAFNLRYEELGNRESGDEPNKPVFGKFTYGGEEPEKLGIRHLRHILNAFAKFYFKTQEPSSVCKDGTPTTDSVPEATNGKCWNMDQDPALLEERRERLEAYALWNEKREDKMLFTKNYLDTLGEALDASNASEIHFEDRWSKSAPILAFIQDLAKNSSLELCKEALEIARDLWLELDALEDHTPEWEGYDFNTVQNNLTDTSDSHSAPTLEIMFDDLKKLGRPFNLRYEIDNGDSGDKADKPVLGKFTYIGEEPEKLGVRNMRHILDGFARFYFKVRHPSIAPMCNSSAGGGESINTR